MDKRISEDIEKIMEARKTVISNGKEGDDSFAVESDEEDGSKYTAQVAASIVAEGDSIGTVIFLSKEEGVTMGTLESKLAETAAGFLGKQMEQ